MFRRLAALLWGFSLFVPVWAGAEGDPPFPPHVFHAKYLAQTHVPEPAPGVTTSCSSCQGGSNRLAFGEKGIVFHRIHLDSSVEKWTDMLLRGDAGFAKPWSPEHEYALFPEGIDGRGDSLMIVLGRMLIKFDRKLDGEGDVWLQSTTHPDFVLRRDGQYLVLSVKDGRKWYFESADLGRSWRLAKMEYTKYPGMFTSLEYTGDKITAIVYPDGCRAVLVYENDLLGSATLPTGEHTRIKRDENGFITLVETMVFFRDGQPLRIFTKKSDLSSARETLAALYRAKDIEKTVVRTFVYENDPRGRIVRFVDQGGTQFKVEYASTAVRL